MYRPAARWSRVPFAVCRLADNKCENASKERRAIKATTRQTASFKTLMVILPALALLLTGPAACKVGSSDGDQSYDAIRQREVQKVIGQAQDAGTNIYWLGDEFRVGSFDFTPWEADLWDAESPTPGLHLVYGADLNGSSIPLDMESYMLGSERAREAADLLLAYNRGAAREPVTVGSWSGEVVSVPSPGRPVNGLVLIFDVADATVVVRGSALSTGVPGEDVSPFIEEDILIQVVADNLQAYPE